MSAPVATNATTTPRQGFLSRFRRSTAPAAAPAANAPAANAPKPRRSMFSFGSRKANKPAPAPAAAPAPAPAPAAPAGPRRTFKNRIFGNAKQQANAGFLAAAKAGNVAKLNTYITDETAKGLLSDDTKQKALFLAAALPSLDCVKLILEAFPATTNATNENKSNILHILALTLNRFAAANNVKRASAVRQINEIINYVSIRKGEFDFPLVDSADKDGNSPVDLLCKSPTKESIDVLEHLLKEQAPVAKDVLNKALADLYKQNASAKNANGWQGVFPKGQVHYKKVSILLNAGATDPTGTPPVYDPLMKHYTAINKKINNTKKALEVEEQTKREEAVKQQQGNEAAAKAAANEAAEAAKAAANALAKAKAAQNKAKKAAANKVSITQKAKANKSAAVAALTPRKKIFGLFGGKRTRKH